MLSMLSCELEFFSLRIPEASSTLLIIHPIHLDLLKNATQKKRNIPCGFPSPEPF